MDKPSYIGFDSERYKKKLQIYTTKGEVGVLSYNYSKKISPFWKFKTPKLAEESANKIYNIFMDNIDAAKKYLHFADSNKISINLIKLFIRADICRKFLLMGYTRSMRYYYHKSGQKWEYDRYTRKWYVIPNEYDSEKKESAEIFKYYYNKALNNGIYIKLKKYFNNLPTYAKSTHNI